jgi:hypothetical protein
MKRLEQVNLYPVKKNSRWTLMRIISATFFLIFVAVSPVFSQWIQNDKPLKDTPDRKELLVAI